MRFSSSSRPVRRAPWIGQPWLWLTADDLRVERRQLADEGLVLAPALAREFRALERADLSSPRAQARAERLLDATAARVAGRGAQRAEPSDLAAIRRLREAGPAVAAFVGDPRDRCLGGWLGRAAGCMLGKPVECRTSDEIAAFLRAQDRWPLDRYFSRRVPADVAARTKIDVDRRGIFEEDMAGVPEDDDLNYTVCALGVLEAHGAGFAPADVARFWLRTMPVLGTCTAERVAYRNLLGGIAPPASAHFRNPYREWIGARIRADLWGYVCPGRPALAAELAWRDASVSHVRNGIYAAMWTAAAIAAAYTASDAEQAIRAGMAQIPREARLTRALDGVLRAFRDGQRWDDAIASLHRRWNERDVHDWCHAVSNTELVAMALLWGGGDFERTVCLSVQHGFDTDCNAATAGSIAGVLLGAGRLPSRWTTPLADTLYTGVSGFHRASFADLADRTCRRVDGVARADGDWVRGLLTRAQDSKPLATIPGVGGLLDAAQRWRARR